MSSYASGRIHQVSVIAFLLLFALGASAAWLRQTPEVPRLVLVLVVDQMRFDYLTRFDDLYGAGLRRLIDEGALFTNARYRHASTSTGPGHSAIFSGRHPRSSGIVGNSWYDLLLGRMVNAVDDPFHQPLGGPGRSASPANFIGFTIGDTLKLSSPESKVVAVSLKDRSAILMAGRLGDAAYWYETEGGIFITSSYYMDEVPAWLDRWNSQRRAARYDGQRWTRLLDDMSTYEAYAGVDAVAGEWDRIDTVFPHRIRGNPPDRAFYDDLQRTPFADQLTLEVSLEAMDAHDLGEDFATDILALGLSGTDFVGHTYGPDSQEIMDQLLRLDLLLGELFDEIEEGVGLERTLVVLTADHGVLPLVENLQSRGIDARRVSPAVIGDAVEAALSTTFPDAGGFVRNLSSSGVYLDTGLIERRGASRSEVESVIIDAVMGTGVVAAVYTQDQLVADVASDDPYIDLYRNSFFSSRSPHLAFRLNEHVYMARFVGGTGHGSPYDYDRHVPIVLMGSRVQPGHYATEAAPSDIAPTLATILGLAFPSEQDTRTLSEALR